jgi:hypothetical protein
MGVALAIVTSVADYLHCCKGFVRINASCTKSRSAAQRCKQTVAVAAAVGTRETIISSSSSSIMLLRCAQDARQQERIVPVRLRVRHWR